MNDLEKKYQDKIDTLEKIVKEQRDVNKSLLTINNKLNHNLESLLRYTIVLLIAYVFIVLAYVTSSQFNFV